ncbi:MAG: hypothetical protein L0Y62_03205, partial [Nitrospirae bacterium]|nr:hypothetical protein [Nitrospirota bacterium]
MKIVTSREMQDIDKKTIRNYGILAAIFIVSVLMPSASHAAEKSSGIIIPLPGITQDVKQAKAGDGGNVISSPDKKILGVWNRSRNTLTLYDTSTLRAIKTYQGSYAAFIRDETIFAIEDSDKKVALYDTATWQPIQGLAKKPPSFNADRSSINQMEISDTVTIYDTATW